MSARVAVLIPCYEDGELLLDAVRSVQEEEPADDHSILGPLKDAPGVYVAATHSGVTLALAIAELLAEEITSGMAPAALAPFHPARFGF